MNLILGLKSMPAVDTAAERQKLYRFKELRFLCQQSISSYSFFSEFFFFQRWYGSCFFSICRRRRRHCYYCCCCCYWLIVLFFIDKRSTISQPIDWVDSKVWSFFKCNDYEIIHSPYPHISLVDCAVVDTLFILRIHIACFFLLHL